MFRLTCLLFTLAWRAAPWGPDFKRRGRHGMWEYFPQGPECALGKPMSTSSRWGEGGLDTPWKLCPGSRLSWGEPCGAHPVRSPKPGRVWSLASSLSRGRPSEEWSILRSGSHLEMLIWFAWGMPRALRLVKLSRVIPLWGQGEKLCSRIYQLLRP